MATHETGSSFADTQSIVPRVRVISNATWLIKRSYTLKVLAKYHKVSVGRNYHSDPSTSFLELPEMLLFYLIVFGT